MGCINSKRKLVPYNNDCNFKEIQSETNIKSLNPSVKIPRESVSSITNSYYFVDPKLPDHPGQFVIGESGNKEINCPV